ncbi:MAG TPA: GerMN domain-containing protein [Vicinamibacterales bacterium]|nr:GerMN domain-containing protein [Vicinamibacterales bacterium]
MTLRGSVRLRMQSSRGLAVTLLAGAAVVLLGVVLLVLKLPALLSGPTPREATDTAAGAGPVEEARRITATLYYVGENGVELVPVTRDVPYGATPAAQARRIAEAQVQPPPDGLLPVVPDGTSVRAVYLSARGEAYVDLSREVVTGHAGGSVNEALTVYAIVNAMIVNLPDVSAVQILVDGQEIDSLAGHLDLRHPLRRSSDWVRKGQ